MRVLFITCNNIYDQYGDGGVKGSQKNWNLLKHCSNVELVTLYFKDSKWASSPESEYCIEQPKGNLGMLFANILGCRRYYPWKLFEIKKIIDLEKIDIIFIDGSLLGNLVAHFAKYKSIVFFHNIEADYTWNKVIHGGLQFLPAYLCTKQNEKRAIKANLIGCLNERDGKLLETKYGRKPDFYLPVSFSDAFCESKTRYPENNRLLFVGSCFDPNVLSIEWFLKNVMTILSNVQIDIVGKGFEKYKAEYEKQYTNVNVIGTVEDLETYYYSHGIVVMPIKFGAGMKVKTAEAMMYGRTIIASDEALVGYNVSEVEGIYRCNSASEYIERIKIEISKQNSIKYNPQVRKLFTDYHETKVQKDFFCKIMKDFDNT